MATSTIPAALAALVSAISAAIDDADVHDGRPTTSNHPDFVCVGYGGGDSTEAVEFTQEPAAIRSGGHPRKEQYDVLCVLSASSGDHVTAVRTRAFELLAAVENVLRPDPSLGVAGVQTMQLAGGTLLSIPSPAGGLAVDIPFRITVRARI